MDATQIEALRERLFQFVTVRRFGQEWPEDLTGAEQVGKHFATQLHARFAATGGIPPVWWVFAKRDPVHKTACRAVYLVEPGAALAFDRRGKDVLAATVRLLAHDAASEMVVMTTEAFMRRLHGPDAEEQARRINAEGWGDDPERVEVAWLAVETPGKSLAWSAPIKRPHDAPAYLEPFEMEPQTEGEGRFFGLLGARP